MHVVLRSIVVAVILAATAGAQAGPLSKPASPEAREHLERGNRLFELKSFDAAIEEYKAGALIENAPLFLHNIALSYRMAGKYDEAIWFYEQFIRRAQPTGEMLHEINKVIDQMKAERDQRAKTMPPTEPPTEPATPPQASVTTTTTPVTKSPDWFGIGMVGAGGAGLIVGGGLLWDAHSLRSDGNSTADQTQRDALYEKADRRTLVGGIVGGVGVAVLATGVIKLIVGRSSGSNPKTAWNVNVSPNSLYVFGRF